MLSASIVFEAPEKITFTYSAASLFNRFLAWLVDGVIRLAVIVLFVVFVLLPSSILRPEMPNNLNSGIYMSGVLFLMLFFLKWIYFSLFEIFLDGSTPGKKLLRIRVIRKNGEQADVSSLILRNLLRVIDELPLFYLLGSTVALITQHTQRIGDLVAGVIVVNVNRARKEPPCFSIPDLERDNLPKVKVNTPLDEQNLYIIRRFLLEREKIPAQRREQMAAQLAAKIGRRVEPVVEPVNGAPSSALPEDFLLAVYRSHRRGYC